MSDQNLEHEEDNTVKLSDSHKSIDNNNENNNNSPNPENADLQKNQLSQKQSELQNLEENKSQMNENKSQIQENKSQINENKSQIQENKSQLNENKSNIDENTNNNQSQHEDAQSVQKSQVSQQQEQEQSQEIQNESLRPSSQQKSEKQQEEQQEDLQTSQQQYSYEAKPKTPVQEQDYVPPCRCGQKILEKLTQQQKICEDLKKKGEQMEQVLDTTRDTMNSISYENDDDDNEPKKKTPQEKNLEKELKSINQEYLKLRNETNRLEAQINQNSNHERVNQLMDATHEVNQHLKKYTLEVNSLKKMIENNNQELQERDQTEELKALREELEKQKKESKALFLEQKAMEKKQITQREYLIRIKARFREVCQQNGVPDTINKDTIERMSKITKVNHEKFQSDNADKIQAKKQFEEDNKHLDFGKHQKLFDEQKEQKRLEGIKHFQEQEKLKVMIKEKQEELENLKKELNSAYSDGIQIQKLKRIADKRKEEEEKNRKQILKKLQTFNIPRLEKPAAKVEYEVYHPPSHKKNTMNSILLKANSRYDDKTSFMDFGPSKLSSSRNSKASLSYASPVKSNNNTSNNYRRGMRSQSTSKSQQFSSQKQQQKHNSEIKLPSLYDNDNQNQTNQTNQTNTNRKSNQGSRRSNRGNSVQV